MPIPLWAIGLALTASSAVARGQQNRKIRNEQEELQGAEAVRERGRQVQRDAALDSTLAQFKPSDQVQKQDQATLKRERAFAETSDAGQVVPGEFAAGGSAPKEVRTELASRVADFLKKGRMETQRRAKLGAFGDTQLDNQVQIGRTGQQLDQLGDFTRGSHRALNAEMLDAQHAGDDWGLFSDLLGAAGTATSLYGFTQPAASAVDPEVAERLWMHNSATGAPPFRWK